MGSMKRIDIFDDGGYLDMQVKMFCRKSNISLSDFAKKCQLSKSSLSRLMSGKQNATAETYRRIVNELHPVV